MKKFKTKLLSAAVILASSSMAMAYEDAPSLESLQQQINALTKDASEGENGFHMAGYFTLNYQSVDGGNYDGRNDFNKASFMPIFMYQMNDKISFEAELEIGTGSEGETDVAMEYAYANIDLTDDLTLVAGKFFVPVGQFKQNIHPSWINKAVSAPMGFGHGGAAPATDVGLQLRGGSYVGDMPIKYAVYFGNGAAIEEGHGGLEVDNEGMTNDSDGTKNFGGRLAIVPVPNLEIAFSYMGGQGGLEQAEATGGGFFVEELTITPDLDVLGADFAYRQGGLTLRGEYIKMELSTFSTQAIHEEDDGDFELETETYLASDNVWTTWYLQAAYRFDQSNWEGVVRFGDFESQVPGSDASHWVVGVNYYFAPTVIAKVNFESQDSIDDSRDSDQILAQLTYGF